MAAVIENELLQVAPERTTTPAVAETVSGYASRTDAIKGTMPELVKGAGFAPKGGNAPLSDQTDITLRAVQATNDLRSAVHMGYNAKAKVIEKGFNPDFLNQFGALRTALATPSIGEQIAQIFGAMPGGADAMKSFTAGNLGIGSVA